MTELDRLIAEREPDPDVLERERLVRTPEYRDPAFYKPFERVVPGGIQAAIQAAKR